MSARRRHRALARRQGRGPARPTARARCSTRRRARSPRRCASPRRPTSTPSWPRPRAAAAEWRRVSLTRRVQVLFAFRELVAQHQEDLARLITARARQGVRRRAGRGRPRPRGRRLRVRHPAPAEGRLQRAGVDRRRRVLDPPAGRRGGRHHAVQLPGHGPHVDVPRGHRLRQRLHPQAQRARPVGARCCSPSCGSEAGLPDGVFSVVHGDKEAVDALLHHPEVAGVSFVGSTPIARYVYETAAEAGKRVQALGGAKNHMIVLPDADLDAGRRRRGERGLRLGRRAVHGDLGGRGRRSDRRRRWSSGSPIASPT